MTKMMMSVGSERGKSLRTNTHVSAPSKDYKILTTFNVIKTKHLQKIEGGVSKKMLCLNTILKFPS